MLLIAGSNLGSKSETRSQFGPEYGPKGDTYIEFGPKLASGAQMWEQEVAQAPDFGSSLSRKSETCFQFGPGYVPKAAPDLKPRSDRRSRSH